MKQSICLKISHVVVIWDGVRLLNKKYIVVFINFEYNVPVLMPEEVQYSYDPWCI